MPQGEQGTGDTLIYGVVRVPVGPGDAQASASPGRLIEWHEAPMVYLKKILVTTDLSPFSLAGLEYATTFGLLYSAEIHLLHVVDEHHPNMEEAKEALRTFVQKNVNPDVEITRVVKAGNPWVVIRRYADEEGVDLIVMATHGRTGLKHVFMGSVAEKVVRFSHVPVLAVKPRPVREHMIRNEDIEKDLHLR